MNSVRQPPVDPVQGDRSSEPIDELLRAFFQAEMPQSLPLPTLPAENVIPFRPATSSWHSGMKSRLVLAASVALLLISSLLLSRHFHANRPAGKGPGATDVSTDKSKSQFPPFTPGR